MNRPPLGHFIRVYSFLAGVLFIVLAAWLFPDLGARGGLFQTSATAKIGVFLVFLIHGLILNTDSFKQGILNWRLHVFIQSFVFGVIPLIVFFTLNFLAGGLSESIKLGFIIMALLPTTISSCVVLTDRAGGNVPASIVSASLSNIIGVFFVPLGVFLYSSQITQDLNLINTLLRISSLIIVPIILGQFIRSRIGPWVERNRISLKNGSRVLVLFIIYAAFCNSIKANNWSEFALPTITNVALLAFVMMILISLLVLLGTRIMNFDYKDTMAAFFCASQKTVVVGVPLVESLIPGNMNLGIVLMPLLFYHTIQLFFGVLVSWQKLKILNNAVLK